VNSESDISVDAIQPLDEDSAVARYRQISDQLVSLMQDSRPGSRLPSEHEIVHRLGVSRATATQALRDLEKRGLVYRRQGRGTFVADTDRAIRTNRSGTLPSFSEDLRRSGKATNEQVISFEAVAPPADIAATLLLGGDDLAWRVERVIVSNGEPVVHLTSWIPQRNAPALDPAAIESSSLYEQLSTTAGSAGRPCSADEQWSAASAPANIAALLEVPRAVPVMRVTRTAYHHDQSPAEYVVSYVRGETFAVSISIDAHQHSGRVLNQLAVVAP